jgi:hypothetical protein
MSVGNWDYKNHLEPCRYGDEPTYEKAAAWLDGCGPVVEDWGCGTGWAKRHFTKSKYVGVDGSWSRFADTVADLRLHRSSCDGILLRHVLEHDYDWHMILENAVRSFTKRLAVVFFMPLEPFTRLHSAESNGSPILILSREGVMRTLKGLSVREEVVSGLEHTYPYHEETIFYVERMV